MINFTTTYSHEFWKATQSELLSFFEEMEDLEYWTVKDEEIYPFLIFFEIQLNNITNLSDLLGKEHQFNSLIENLSYLKLGTFFYWVHAVNKEQPSFIFSCLLHCREEKNIFEKLFIEPLLKSKLSEDILNKLVSLPPRDIKKQISNAVFSQLAQSQELSQELILDIQKIQKSWGF